MRILIAGLAKTGTTGLHFLVVNSFSQSKSEFFQKPKLLFEPSECPSELLTSNENIIAKVLIGKHLNVGSFSSFNKKITIVRDPRDRIISSLLYSQFHADYVNDIHAIQEIKALLEKKEATPSGISIKELLQNIGKLTGNENRELNHRKAVEASLKLFDDYVDQMPDSLLYKYESFVSGEYLPLEQYLGFAMSGKADVPESLSRVNRTKDSGDWRNWFTEEDVEIYKPIISPWLTKYGYDSSDWRLNEKPQIAKDHCSAYFMRLIGEKAKKPHKPKKNIVAQVKKTSKERKLTGVIQKAQPGLISGWVVGDNPNVPIRVALLVDGKKIAETIANKPRPAIKQKGWHLTGLCGFVFRFKPEKYLTSGTQVSVQPINSDFKIGNSPCMVSA